MPTLQTNGLYITRKRKKWKFAHFDSWPNCFSHLRNDDPKLAWQAVKAYLPKNQPLILEIAAGNAQFSFQLAKMYPNKNFIAIDIKSDRLYTSAKQALEEKVPNIAFLRMSMYELSRVIPKNSVELLWLTFPDPFMRGRSIRRRLTHPLFLKQYHEILKKEGALRFKTDNQALFLWSLEQFVAEKWQFNELTFDLHESSLPREYKIKTQYEQRYFSAGKNICFCSIS